MVALTGLNNFKLFALNAFFEKHCGKCRLEYLFNLLKNQKLKMKELMLITTSSSLEGYRVTEQLGIVRGLTVRSRSVLGNMAGGFMTIFGGRSSIYSELCETARKEALNLMIAHGHDLNCNAY